MFICTVIIVVGSLAWNSDLLTSGGRDGHIILRDFRAPSGIQSSIFLNNHRQEVCGLRWNQDGDLLASGGNDNKVVIWSRHTMSPMYNFEEHTAAVKGISWSPHERNVLATGGGTADKKLRLYNVNEGRCLATIDTGSQVCNLAWSSQSNELVSTHGFSQNQVVVWHYPSMEQLAVLTGHTSRVLYLATCPDGQSIVTGAGDERLCFWDVFEQKQNSLGGYSRSKATGELGKSFVALR